MDALKALGDDDSVDNLAKSMENTAERTADVIRGIGVLIAKLKEIPGMPDFGVLYDISYLALLEKLGQKSQIAPKPFTTPMTISGQVLIKQQKVLNDLIDDQAKKQAKILKDKKLQAAIDKANLALNKGSDVFDMDKIQIAAALTNQAEALGKATSASQALQIANDTARLNVKKSILALEDAIASKDEASIVAATNKLNADLKVLGALNGQSLKLSDIKSILESLKPVDLVNLGNLDAAIAKMLELIRLQGVKPPTSGTTGVTTGGGGVAGGSGMTAEDSHLSKLAGQAPSSMTKPSLLNTPFDMGGTFNLEDVARSSLLQGLAGGAGVSGAVSGSRYAAQAANQYNITVQAGVGDPNAIAEAIDNVLREAQQRGTLTTI